MVDLADLVGVMVATNLIMSGLAINTILKEP